MSQTAVICPTSTEKVNENVARTAAFITIAIVSVGVYFNEPIIIALLAFDFYLRAFTNGYYSPIKLLSKQIVAVAGVTQKPGDAAPKRFAAAMGLFFTAAIAVLQSSQYTIAADVLAGLLIFFALLEGAFGFCLGCVIYTYLVAPFISTDSEPVTIEL